MIEVSNLTKNYGIIPAVKNISFKVNQGEIVGFLGPNGAGKSTTMKILTCYISPTSGDVKIKDYNIYTHTNEIRKIIGYLPETNPLYDDMMVKEYLEFVAELRQIPVNKRRTSLNETIEKCGLKSVVYKYINELSKGYRQRVGLAQALIHNPDILILDEPTSGLDPGQIIEIRELIKQIGKEKTIILSTHILQEVDAVCNRVLIINKGKLVADDSLSNLKANSLEEQILNVKLEKVVSKNDILEKIEKIEKIKELNIISESDNILFLELKSDNLNNVPEQIFKLAVDNNLILTELHKETVSLEDLFLELTK